VRSSAPGQPDLTAGTIRGPHASRSSTDCCRRSTAFMLSRSFQRSWRSQTVECRTSTPISVSFRIETTTSGSSSRYPLWSTWGWTTPSTAWTLPDPCSPNGRWNAQWPSSRACCAEAARSSSPSPSCVRGSARNLRRGLFRTAPARVAMETRRHAHQGPHRSQVGVPRRARTEPSARHCRGRPPRTPGAVPRIHASLGRSGRGKRSAKT
jgi:hypothetical protein